MAVDTMAKKSLPMPLSPSYRKFAVAFCVASSAVPRSTLMNTSSRVVTLMPNELI